MKKREEFATSRAGITGLIRTQESKTRETDQNLQQAFSDINALMEKAKDMVQECNHSRLKYFAGSIGRSIRCTTG